MTRTAAPPLPLLACAVAFSALTLGCTYAYHDARATGRQLVAPSDGPVVTTEVTDDPLYGEAWGSYPPKSKYVVVVTGSVGELPLRLWFLAPDPLLPGTRLALGERTPFNSSWARRPPWFRTESAYSSRFSRMGVRRNSM